MASIIGWVIDVRSTVKPRMVMLLRSVRMAMAQSSIESEMAVMSISSIDPTKDRNHEEQEDDPDDEHQVGDQDRQPARHVALQPLDHRCEQEGDERCDYHRHQDAARQDQTEDPDQHQPDDDEKPGGVALGGLDAWPVGVVQRAPPVESERDANAEGRCRPGPPSQTRVQAKANSRPCTANAQMTNTSRAMIRMDQMG